MVYATFRYAPDIAARISGLILAAIGIQFIALGLTTLLSGLR